MTAVIRFIQWQRKYSEARMNNNVEIWLFRTSQCSTTTVYRWGGLIIITFITFWCQISWDVTHQKLFFKIGRFFNRFWRYYPKIKRGLFDVNLLTLKLNLKFSCTLVRLILILVKLDWATITHSLDNFVIELFTGTHETDKPTYLFYFIIIMKIVQVVHTEEKNKQTNKRTNKQTQT